MGPLHKKQKRVAKRPPAEVRYVDKDRNEFVYHLAMVTHEGHKMVYTLKKNSV